MEALRTNTVSWLSASTTNWEYLERQHLLGLPFSFSAGIYGNFHILSCLFSWPFRSFLAPNFMLSDVLCKKRRPDAFVLIENTIR
jgi:hypothetical protein